MNPDPTTNQRQQPLTLWRCCYDEDRQLRPDCQDVAVVAYEPGCAGSVSEPGELGAGARDGDGVFPTADRVLSDVAQRWKPTPTTTSPTPLGPPPPGPRSATPSDPPAKPAQQPRGQPRPPHPHQLRFPTRTTNHTRRHRPLWSESQPDPSR